jgi:hypothetical protein
MVDYRSLLGLSFDPSEEQKAILRRNEDTIVRALPGSGKTTILTLKLMELLLSGKVSGKICCISYTNLNVSDLREECERILPDELLKNIDFLTFHGFCQRFILLPYSYLVKSLRGNRPFSTLFDFDLHGEALLGKLDQKRTDDIDKIKYDGQVYYKFYQTANGWKVTGEKISKDSFDRYFQFLNDNQLIDFNQILFYSHRVLEEWAFVPIALNLAFDWIFIDEFQDVTEPQYEIFQLLRKCREQIGTGVRWFLVGDPNQSIYGFAGANPKSMFEAQQFLNHINGFDCEQTLKISYRCSAPVFEFVARNYNKVIQLIIDRTFQGEQISRGFKEYFESLKIPSGLIGSHRDGKVQFSGWEDSLRMLSDNELNSSICCIGVTTHDSFDLFRNFQGDKWTFGELARVFWESVAFDSQDQSKELFSFFCSYIRVKMAAQFAEGDYHRLLGRLKFFVNKMVARVGTNDIDELVVDRIIADTLSLDRRLNLKAGLEIESQEFLDKFGNAMQQHLQIQISIAPKKVNSSRRDVPLSDFVMKLQLLDSEGTFFEIRHIHKIKGLEYKKIIVRRTHKIPYKADENHVHNVLYGESDSPQTVTEKELLDYIQELNKLYVMLTRSKSDVFIDDEGGLCKFIDPTLLKS